MVAAVGRGCLFRVVLIVCLFTRVFVVALALVALTQRLLVTILLVEVFFVIVVVLAAVVFAVVRVALHLSLFALAPTQHVLDQIFLYVGGPVIAEAPFDGLSADLGVMVLARLMLYRILLPQTRSVRHGRVLPALCALRQSPRQHWIEQPLPTAMVAQNELARLHSVVLALPELRKSLQLGFTTKQSYFFVLVGHQFVVVADHAAVVLVHLVRGCFRLLLGHGALLDKGASTAETRLVRLRQTEVLGRHRFVRAQLVRHGRCMLGHRRPARTCYFARAVVIQVALCIFGT